MSVSCVDCVSSALPLYGLIARVSTHIYISTYLHLSVVYCQHTSGYILYCTWPYIALHAIITLHRTNHSGLPYCTMVREHAFIHDIEERGAGDFCEWRPGDTNLRNSVKSIVSHCNEVWLLSSVARVCPATTHL